MINKIVTRIETLEEFVVYANDDYTFLVQTATALKTNTTLKRLDVRPSERATDARRNGDITFPAVPMKVIVAFRYLLKENAILQDLKFSGEDKKDEEISFWLNVNRLRRKYLTCQPKEEGSPTNNDWIKIIVDNRKNAAVVYYMLSINPTILFG
jgi:hypothetical protein